MEKPPCFIEKPTIWMDDNSAEQFPYNLVTTRKTVFSHQPPRRFFLRMTSPCLLLTSPIDPQWDCHPVRFPKLGQQIEPWFPDFPPLSMRSLLGHPSSVHAQGNPYPGYFPSEGRSYQPTFCCYRFLVLAKPTKPTTPSHHPFWSDVPL